jgi:hypothetical protein
MGTVRKQHDRKVPVFWVFNSMQNSRKITTSQNSLLFKWWQTLSQYRTAQILAWAYCHHGYTTKRRTKNAQSYHHIFCSR